MLDMEREYNNRAAVPDFAAIMAGWRTQAAEYRTKTPYEAGIVYGQSERSRMDIFPAINKVRQNASLALFIHGGYWQALDGSFFSHVAKGLNYHGIDVAVMTYDLCPDVRIENIVESCQRAAIFLWQRYKKKIVPFGHSAGGHLTAALLATDWKRLDQSLPEGLACRGYSISGLFDLAPLILTTINEKLQLDSASAQQNSPLFASDVRGKQLLTTVGELESGEYHRQSRLVHHVWAAHGANTVNTVQSGKNHFTIVDLLSDPKSLMTNELISLFQD